MGTFPSKKKKVRKVSVHMLRWPEYRAGVGDRKVLLLNIAMSGREANLHFLKGGEREKKRMVFSHTLGFCRHTGGHISVEKP